MKRGSILDKLAMDFSQLTRGQIVKAFVVLNPGFDASDKPVAQLQDFVKNSVAPYQYPRVISFVEALPRTETGKLKRFELRRMT